MATKQTTKISENREDNAQADVVVASTALVVATDADLAVEEVLLHLDKHFATAAYRSAFEPESRPLFWQNGNNDVYTADGKKRLMLEAGVNGWYINQPREEAGLFPADFELLDAMDLLVERGMATPCQISHSDDKVPAWLLHTVSLFVVCQGVPSQTEMQRDARLRWGVAYGWGPDARSQKVRSQLQFSCYVKELWDAGYAGAFKVSMTGEITRKMLECLKAQEYVLNFVEGLRNQAGEDTPLPFYATALPTKASDAPMRAGKGEASSDVHYPIPLIPRLSQRDLIKARTYLEWTAVSADQAAIIEDNARVENAVIWSVEKSARIITGQADDDDQAGEVAGAPGDYVGVDVDGKPLPF